ncbi:MAG: hypothetical protein ABEH58_07975, partial [Haloplanus sp.]
MSKRRTFLQTVGGLAGVGLIGLGSATETQLDDVGGDADTVAQMDRIGAMEPAVEYVRNVEEVRGHLASSATLLEQGRREDAALHAGHPADYFGTILTPLRDADPGLATRARAVLKTPAQRIQSMSAGNYRQYLNDQVLPILDRVVETMVAGNLRESTAFDIRVMNALAGRIADEYSAAVPSAGTVDKVGEYWDGRGFLVRIEGRYAGVESALDGAGSEALTRLRTSMEDVAAAGDVRLTTLQFRMRAAAAADLPSATVEGREDALTYVRNVEEVRGHLNASIALKQVGDEDAALHAGHPADYVLTVLPPVQASDPDLANRLFDRMV